MQVEMESLERELKSTNEVGSKISANINPK